MFSIGTLRNIKEKLLVLINILQRRLKFSTRIFFMDDLILPVTEKKPTFLYEINCLCEGCLFKSMMEGGRDAFQRLLLTIRCYYIFLLRWLFIICEGH